MGCSTRLRAAVRVCASAIIVCSGCMTVCSVASAAEQASARLSFNRDIRPILSDNCFACHGPDNANRQAGLRLDTFEQATAELDSGAKAIVPEKPGESELIARIVSEDPDAVMPPPHAKIGRLSEEQVDLLKRWVAQGAPYEPHWAFVPAVKPELPTAEGQAAAAMQRIGRPMALRQASAWRGGS